MSGDEIKSVKNAQTHLSELILQSQEQVGERAQRLIGLVTGRPGGEVPIEVSLDCSRRPVQSAHLFTQPGLVVLQHVEEALNVGVNRVAGAGGL